MKNNYIEIGKILCNYNGKGGCVKEPNLKVCDDCQFSKLINSERMD